MKRVFAGIGIVLVAVSSSAQVKILSFNQAGMLRWTNSVDSPVSPPIYLIERSPSPTGPWLGLAAVTNRTLVSMTNLSALTSTSAYFRVTWTNGSVWSYREYDNQGTLLVTGKLYMSSLYLDGVGLYSVSGTWYRTNAVAGGNPWFGVPRGRFNSVPSVIILPGEENAFTIDFGTYGEPHFVLGGYLPMGNTWSGNWGYSGGIIYFHTNGPFTMERLSGGE